MPSIIIEDFRFGLDTRKLALTAPPGTLRELTNAHITRGGELEKAKSFVEKFDLPVGSTFGLATVDGVLYTFGSAASPGVIPAGVTYQQLVHPDNPAHAMTSVLDVKAQDSKLYVIVQFDTGEIFHYYDGALVKDWGAGVVRAGMTGNNGIAAYMAALIGTTADVTATVLNNIITITANAQNVPFTISAQADDGGAVDDQVAVVTTPVAASAGVAQVSTVTIGGTFEVGDQFTVTINSYPYGFLTRPSTISTGVLPLKKKLYFFGDKRLNFSGVGAPTKLSSQDTGAGFINMSAEAPNFESTTALGSYFNSLAVFGKRTTQIWSMDADPTKNFQSQIVLSTGTVFPKSVHGASDGTLMYLARSGVRALKARDASNFATISEIGTAIDEEVGARIKALTADQRKQVVAEIEPLDNRYWLAIAGSIYVFSLFTGSKVSAWSRYDPGLAFTDLAVIDDFIYARAGDTVYLYGGDGGDQYTAANQTVIVLPFLDAKNPGLEKDFEGIDAALQGLWKVEVATDPNQPEEFEEIAIMSKSTYTLERIPFEGKSTHVSLRFTSLDANYGKIGQVMIHYKGGETG